MKKVLMFACALVIAGSSFANTPDVNEKVLKAFKATFTDAENVEWSDAFSLYTVRFTHQGIRTFVKYDDDGNFISCRRYYNAETLPVDIQCKLRKRFADKKIFGCPLDDNRPLSCEFAHGGDGLWWPPKK